MAALSRPAIRTLTMEFPGCLTPVEYTAAKDRQLYADLVALYAAAIHHVFLEPYAVEEEEWIDATPAGLADQPGLPPLRLTGSRDDLPGNELSYTRRHFPGKQ